MDHPNFYSVGPNGLCALHGTQHPLLRAFLSLSLLALLFSQKGLSYGSEILHGGLTYKRNIIWGEGGGKATSA